MTDKLTIAMAQINPTVGDIGGNVARILAARDRSLGADLVVYSELVLSGYPPEDLVLKPFFQDRIEEAANQLAAATGDGGAAMLIGAPWRHEGGLYNAVLLLEDGAVAAVRFKQNLPNYSVFDEKRIFDDGPMPGPVNFRDVRIGVPVCEDIWSPEVPECLVENGAEILIVVNGSPFESDKGDIRLQHAVQRVTETGLPLLYVNQVGGQDELVFDGGSFALNANCGLAARQPAFTEDILMTQWHRDGNNGWVCAVTDRAAHPEGLGALYQAMVLGLADYVNKNGFPGVILGLSGGIDSALSAAVAVDALGPDRVRCVMMPSPYTSQDSLDDARECAQMLGVQLDDVRIEPAIDAFNDMLAPMFGDRPPDTTEENIQARSRGLTLMAISNKLGHMVLTTGNKSEMSVGYATLYGDMCGGFSVLKDVYKCDVFKLSHWRNQSLPERGLGPAGRVIPERIITKPPSAELRPDQTDQDSLPPYDELDDILSCLIENEMGLAAICQRGHDQQTVQRVWRMLDRAEYKRRQAPPGVKLTRRAFGRDRRYPITNSFHTII